MNFFDNPQTQDTFGAPASASLELLRTSAKATAILAAIRDGWFDPNALLEVDHNGEPWLSRWMATFNGRSTTPWNDQAWPTTPEGDWTGVGLAASAGRYHADSPDTQGELLMGWILSNAPDGLGRLRWSLDPQNVDEKTGSILGSLLKNRWQKAFQVALSRTDCPTPQELDGLEIALGHGAVLAKRDSSGILSAQHGSHWAPLMHFAVQENLLGSIQALTDAGATLDPRSQDGTPLYYRANSEKTLQHLVEKGADILQKHPTGIAALAFWELARSQSSQCSPPEKLTEVLNHWIRDHHTPEQLARLKMPELSALLASPPSFAAFTRQAKQLKIPASIAWEEGGQEWTWARQALAMVLDAPAQTDACSSWEWAIEKPLRGAQPLTNAPNEDLLWLVGQSNDIAQASWTKQAQKHQWTTPLEDPLRIHALMEALKHPQLGIWPTHSPAALERNGWRLELGGAQYKAGQDPRPTWLTLVETAKNDDHFYTASKWAHVLLTDARRLLRTPETAHQAGWLLAECLVLSGHMQPHLIQSNSAKITDESLAQNSVHEEDFKHFGEALIHAIGVLREAGGTLEDGAKGQRIQKALDPWDSHPTLNAHRPRLIQLLLDNSLAPLTAPARPSVRF